MTRIEQEQAWRQSNTVLRWLLWRLLRLVERLLLSAYGWQRCDDIALDEQNAWCPADGHPKAGDYYDHDHAVNSTKYYAGRRTPRGREQQRVGRRRRGRFA